MNQRQISILKYVGKAAFLVFLLFQFYILARFYLFASCVIPTYSMSPALQNGDYIVVSIQIPGRRVWKKEDRLIVHRKKGIREIRRNDVVVFNFPYAQQKDKMILDTQLFYCKRCVAIPGETYQWHWENKLHRIYLPKKGDILPIHSLNYEDYHKCIEYETNRQLHCRNDSIYLGDSIIHHYRFRHNYYFMRGDNSGDSYDSRFWGILPNDFILGVGQFIWFSKGETDSRVRWERIFKQL